jgi:hypothetical protein
MNLVWMTVGEFLKVKFWGDWKLGTKRSEPCIPCDRKWRSVATVRGATVGWKRVRMLFVHAIENDSDIQLSIIFNRTYWIYFLKYSATWTEWDISFKPKAELYYKIWRWFNPASNIHFCSMYKTGVHTTSRRICQLRSRWLHETVILITCCPYIDHSFLVPDIWIWGIQINF